MSAIQPSPVKAVSSATTSPTNVGGISRSTLEPGIKVRSPNGRRDREREREKRAVTKSSELRRRRRRRGRGVVLDTRSSANLPTCTPVDNRFDRKIRSLGSPAPPLAFHFSLLLLIAFLFVSFFCYVSPMNLTAALISSSVIRMKGTGERSISKGVEVAFLFFSKGKERIWGL